MYTGLVGRVLVFLLVVLVVLAAGYAFVAPRFRGHRFDRPSVVLDPYIQANAHENFVMLEQAVGLLSRVLEADESLPVLTARQREEAARLVQQFNRRQLG